MPQYTTAAPGLAPHARHLADHAGGMPQICAGALGRILLDQLRQLAVVAGPLGDELPVDQAESR